MLDRSPKLQVLKLIHVSYFIISCLAICIIIFEGLIVIYICLFSKIRVKLVWLARNGMSQSEFLNVYCHI